MPPILLSVCILIYTLKKNGRGSNSQLSIYRIQTQNTLLSIQQLIGSRSLWIVIGFSNGLTGLNHKNRVPPNNRSPQLVLFRSRHNLHSILENNVHKLIKPPQYTLNCPTSIKFKHQQFVNVTGKIWTRGFGHLTEK